MKEKVFVKIIIKESNVDMEELLRAKDIEIESLKSDLEFKNNKIKDLQVRNKLT